MSNLHSRLVKIEQSIADAGGQCRVCGGKHVRDLIAYIQTPTDTQACGCPCCPDWSALEANARV
jgi:hypothetical protein